MLFIAFRFPTKIADEVIFLIVSSLIFVLSILFWEINKYNKSSNCLSMWFLKKSSFVDTWINEKIFSTPDERVKILNYIKSDFDLEDGEIWNEIVSKILRSN